jgi:hypothetical protein
MILYYRLVVINGVATLLTICVYLTYYYSRISKFSYIIFPLILMFCNVPEVYIQHLAYGVTFQPFITNAYGLACRRRAHLSYFAYDFGSKLPKIFFVIGSFITMLFQLKIDTNVKGLNKHIGNTHQVSFLDFNSPTLKCCLNLACRAMPKIPGLNPATPHLTF